MKTLIKNVCLLLLFLHFFYVETQAQAGFSSASFSLAKDRTSYNNLPPSAEIVVEEILNYHRHRLPLPKSGESVAMDLRWGNSDLSPSLNEAIFQVGFTTETIDDYSQIPPLNICFVMDCSGSMEGDKMTKVQEALITVIKKFRPTDIISIVCFSTEARVFYPAKELGDGTELIKNIPLLLANGSTNMYDGLIYGYKEVEKNLREDVNSRVILLTDGLMNAGVTNKEKLIVDSKAYNDKKIELSVIGVGSDLDQNLLRELTSAGKGLIHFVHDPNDMQKVFVNELESLLSPVTLDVKLEIIFDEDLELTQFYGYNPLIGKNSIELKLNNMNSGLTQVLLMKYKVKKHPSKKKIAVKCKLTYFDIQKGKNVEKIETSELSYLDDELTETPQLFKDKDIKKNYTIALLAQSMKDMCKSSELNEKKEVKKIAEVSENWITTEYPSLKDEDIQRVYELLKGFEEIIKNE